MCDEIVVNQESQILPAFIIELDLESCQSEYTKWVRDIPLPMNDAALHNYGNDAPHSNSGSVTGRDAVSCTIISMDGMFSLSLSLSLSHSLTILTLLEAFQQTIQDI